MVAEKLDFLMKLTHTNNSTLARALSFDPSYIGRIRAGKRGIPKHQPFLEPAASYFARNLTQPYQQKAVAELLCPGKSWPADRMEAEQLLLRWFTAFEDRSSVFVGTLLSGLSFAGSDKKLPVAEIPSSAKSLTDIAFYYGRLGKREAVEAFLTPLALSGEAHTLLLYSDEDFSWLYEDPAFTRRWLALMTGIIRNGGRIRIIHTVSRGIGEMLEAVQKWMPLYATGSIEPYYYPRLRDGIYHRTLFIARGHSAITSDSVAGNDERKLNLLIRDQAAVAALEEEYNDYLSLCRPLMQIYNARSAEQYFASAAEFTASGGDLICAGPLPADRGELSGALAGGHRVTELLHLPALPTTGLPSPLSDFSGAPGEVTFRELASRLRGALEMLRTEPHYRLILTDTLPEDVVLQAKEGVGVIFYRAAPPSTVFCISENNLTSSFWEYLSRLADNSQEKEVARQIEQYLARLTNTSSELPNRTEQ